MPAFVRLTADELLAADPDLIVGRLTHASSDAGHAELSHAQTEAWLEELALLRAALRPTRGEFPVEGWGVLLEYPIPRRGKRIDAVVLGGRVVVVLEFKCGARSYGREAVAQVEDYALDPADFHRESDRRPIVPVLVATLAPPKDAPAGEVLGGVQATRFANAETLAGTLMSVVRRHAGGEGTPIDPARWDASEYAPTRPPERYDRVATYLARCGIPSVDGA